MEDESNFKTPSRPTKRSRIEKRATDVVYSPMAIPPSPMMKKLGCGTGVVVYRLERGIVSPMTKKSPWAVKKAKKAKDEAFKRLKIESDILKKLCHPNIISYRNFSLMANGDACLSMEQGGISLDTLIEEHCDQGINFTAFQTASVTVGIAKALSYLHNNHKLLHGDVKSGNVLVADNFKRVKLCDFGVALYLKDDLSAPLHDSDFYTGTQPWCSKEVLDNGPSTDKADIFAYGLLIWEMLALDVPHVGLLAGDNEEDSIDEDAYTEALGTRPALPNKDFGPLFMPIIGVFACCTETDYKTRPNAEQIVKAFEPTASELKIDFE